MLASTDATPKGCGVTVINEAVTIYLLLQGIVEPTTEIQKLGRKLALVQKQVADLNVKTGVVG